LARLYFALGDAVAQRASATGMGEADACTA
jgi:hypothetical protein